MISVKSVAPGVRYACCGIETLSRRRHCLRQTRSVLCKGAQATKQPILPLCGTMDCFASLAMTVSNRCSLSRALAAVGIQPGINPALKPRKSFQALRIGERQQLHQDHAGDVARRVDPEIGVGE